MSDQFVEKQHRVPKHLAPCTAALDPQIYEYLLNYIDESTIQRQLREQGETLERANMMASADEYQFLGWLCATLGVKRAVEVGVFRGVTTLAIAMALPDDGVIKALDISKEYAAIGEEAWKAAGVRSKIDFVEGAANESMQRMIDNGESGSYDFVFIDANKDQYPEYYELALQLVRKGGVIAVDNSLFKGYVVSKRDDPHVRPAAELNDTMKNDSRVSAVMTIIADGVYFARKL